MRCGSTTAVMSSHCAVQRSNCGARTSAATAVIAFTASTMRRIVPRLRKSGSAGAIGVLPYNRLHIETGMQASCRRPAPGRCPTRAVAAAIVGNPRRRGKPEPDATAGFPTSIRAVRRFAPSGAARPLTCRERIRLPWPTPSRRTMPRPPAAGPAASASPCRRARQALHGVGGFRSPPRRRGHRAARSRTPGCWPPSACCPRADLAAIERGMETIRGEVERGEIRVVARPRGRPLQHRAAADRAGRRRRQAAAYRTLAQRPGRHRPPALAARGDRRARRRRSPRCARAFIDLAETPRRHDHARLHAPAGRAARHLRPPSARLRSDVRARRRAARATAAGASTGCRWAARRSPARASRSTASAWRAELGFEALCAQFARRRVRPRFRRSNSRPPPRWR